MRAGVRDPDPDGRQESMGVDMIRMERRRSIIDFKVRVRPLKAIFPPIGGPIHQGGGGGGGAMGWMRGSAQDPSG